MIAVRTDLEADINSLVDALARERKALVSVEALRSKLEWDADRFGDAAAEAEDAGRCQSWDASEDGGGLVMILSPVEAERRDLVLGTGHNDKMLWNWYKAGSRALGAIQARASRPWGSRRQITESGLFENQDGLGWLENTPDNRPGPLLALVGEEVQSGEATNELGERVPKYKRKFRDPFAIRTGDEAWPLPGCEIQDWKISKEAGVVREMVVVAETCPACGGTRERRTPGCVTCEHFQGDDKLLKSQRAHLDVLRAQERWEDGSWKNDPATAETIETVMVDPETGKIQLVFKTRPEAEAKPIKFKPKLTRARKAVAV